MTTERHTHELPADLITPVGAYLRLREALGAPAFLLESVERGEQVGRYSFLAAGLPAVDTLEEAAAFAASQPGPAAGAPPFAGGAVGFLSYDWVSELEPVPPAVFASYVAVTFAASTSCSDFPCAIICCTFSCTPRIMSR